MNVKHLAWNVFCKTGNVYAYLLYNNIKEEVSLNGTYKGKRYCAKAN